MSAVERPADGPDTELAAAIAYFRQRPDQLDVIRGDARAAQEYAETIVRAVLARPAAGRDLTPEDVKHWAGLALRAGGKVPHYLAAASALTRIARPAAARTDLSLTAGDSWRVVPAVEDLKTTDGEVIAKGQPAKVVHRCGRCGAERTAASDEEWSSPAVPRPDGQPPADDTAAPDEVAQTIANMTALIEWTERDGDETGEFFRHDGYVLMVDDLRRAVRALRAGDTATPRSVAELPATLRTVEDVAAVCEAAGLDSGEGEDEDPAWGAGSDLFVCAEPGLRVGEFSTVSVYFPTTDDMSAILFPDTPSTVLLAAIRAAQGGTQ